jgi:flagellar L-ring protein precursor FlgH
MSTTLLRIFAVTLTVLVATCVPGYAESLWQPQSANSPFSDKRAAKVGDIVTVIIVESATATSSASTDAKKDSKSQINAGQGPILSNVPAITWGGGDSMAASGTTSRTSKFVGKVSATVKKVRDNGDLEIEATRTVQTNKEKEEICLTGTVRRADIAADNSILSTYVADASITYIGNGPIGSRQKEGLLSKVFRIFF